VIHLVQFDSVDNVVKQSTFNKATGTFTIPARTTAVFEFSPQEMMRSLITEINSLVSGGHLTRGQGNSLIGKLNNAIQNLDANRPKNALNNLNALSNQIRDFIATGVLTSEEGQALLQTVESIRLQIMVRYNVN
jgi:hypothetical protein